MRVALALIASLSATSLVAAEPKPPIVWQNRVIDDGVAAPLTSVSHKLYLNDCRPPNNCTVSPGSDNSLTNRSSIPISTVVLDPYAHGDAHWDLLVECVRDTFKPFNVEIVTEDPGNVPHFEVMIGGTSRQLNPNLDAGGVAPFISCNATRDSAISFVFASQTSSINFLCGAVAQEACHVWGLDHELNALDPMTYLDLGSSKRFQNDDAQCGEDTPRRCRCNGSTQNSFRYMTQTFGLSPTLVDPTLVINTPVENQWVKPGFPIAATLTSDLYTLTASLSIDGAHVEDAANGFLAFNAPDLPTGKHAITVSATDAGDRTLMTTVNVNVAGSCSAAAPCPSDLFCHAGQCLPGANEPGGLGADCANDGECLTGSCASDGTDQLCTAACDNGTCPSGFTCLDGQNVCWPGGSDGGCTTNGSNGAGFALVGLGLLAVLARRRR